MTVRTKGSLGNRIARQSCLRRIETVLKKFSSKPDGAEIIHFYSSVLQLRDTLIHFRHSGNGWNSSLSPTGHQHLERAVRAHAIGDLLVQRRKGRYLENVPV